MLSGTITITNHPAPPRVGDCSGTLPAIACQNISAEVSETLRLHAA